jgi:N-methylhydantoinase A
MTCDRARDAELRSVLGDLTAHVLASLGEEGIEAMDARTELTVDCRYQGQSHELRIPVSGGPSFALLIEAFHLAHRERYGFARERVPVEAVTFRAAALGPPGDVTVAPPSRSSVRAEPVGERSVDGDRVPVYRRGDLGAGERVAGPAIVAELDSTTWIDRGASAEVHPSGALVVTVR